VNPPKGRRNGAFAGIVFVVLLGLQSGFVGSSAAAPSFRFLAKWGTGKGKFHHPVDVATDCRGAVYVVDNRNNRIEKFGIPGTPKPPCRHG
jgi:hypothetical protein